MTSSRSIPTRRISFEPSLHRLPRHFAGDDDLIMSHVIVTLSSVFPDGEDYFVRSVRHFRDQITDPDLKRQVSGFIGQESVHGREHRLLNDRFDELGYWSKRLERFIQKILAVRERVFTPKSNLAATAALEHFTATLAEKLLTDPEARRRIGDPEVQKLFLWHALEEAEHKAVAFDVYRAVGGSEWLRIATMRFLMVGFIGGMSLQAIISLLTDRTTYRWGELRKSVRRLMTSPFLTREMWERLDDYNRRGFHPDDHDNTALVDEWRAALFGEEGALNDKLAGTATISAVAIENFDVLVVGAGLSGIGAAHHLQTECSWASYAIFEARDSIGGTWDLFRYPGIRSDSDMFTLGYPFRPWTGEKAIADGPSILDYVVSTAREAGIDEKIRFRRRILGAAWLTDEARWTVTGERTDTGEQFEVTCDFLFSCSGYYRYDRGYLPDFEGMDRFEGTVVHPQFWPEALDYSGKRVVVIGSGATAVTLIPAMAEDAAHVTMLQRSPSYVVSMPAVNPLANLLRRVLPRRVAGPVLRWMNVLFTQGTYQLSHRRPELVKKLMRKGIERELPAGYDIDTHFTPSYNPWDQRVCLVPDGDLFAAIRHGTASIVTDHIETFTEHGIQLTSGSELEADVIVTATGLEVLFLGGIEVSIDGETVDLTQRMTYKGMMLEDVPNLAFAIGYTNASWTLKADLTSGYVMRLLNHLRSTGLRQCTPVNHGAVADSSSIFSLSSGYLTRAIDRLPKQGDAFPWKVHQSYLADYRAMRLRDVTDDAMQFSNPRRAEVRSRRSVSEPEAEQPRPVRTA